jgi:hypothetical protein
VLGAAVIVMTVHAAAGGAALVFLPRGFPPSSIHTWSNTWIPAAVALALVLALVRFVFMRSSARPVSLATAGIAGGWLGAVLAGSVLFPISFGVERAIGPGAIAIAFAVLAWATKFGIAESVGAAVGGGVLGVVEIMAQEGPPPSTRPNGGTPVEVKGELMKDDAQTGQVSFPCGKEHVRVRPLLTFESRSPDATWTLLAPHDAFGPHRRFDAFEKEKNGFRAHYIDDGETSLVAMKDAKGLDIEAISRLPHSVYSHLNAFTTIHVPFDATIAFGPTGAQEFPLDGPPLQFAFLGADISFHVVRSSEAEKGPYTEIATGHLGRDEALTITLKNKNGGTCKLTFKDWASQLSTEPSPTAGWGVPQNSIQFSARAREKEGFIVLTLAETGPGRGWLPVAHEEGTYRNRIRVDAVMDAPKAK